ncbi:hypothetical protein CVT26_003374, partial [Gymnopilus dilepis]
YYHNSPSSSIPHATHHLKDHLIRTQALQRRGFALQNTSRTLSSATHMALSPKWSLLPALDEQELDGWRSRRVMSWRVFSCLGGCISIASDSRAY